MRLMQSVTTTKTLSIAANDEKYTVLSAADVECNLSLASEHAGKCSSL